VIRLAAVFLTGATIAVACNQKSHSTSSHSQQRTSSSSETATVVRDVDGDTIKVRLTDGVEHNVRLIGIDTPETHKPGVAVECGGPEASALAAKLAPAGAKAKLTYDPTQDRIDRYKRLLAYVSVNGHSIQLAELRAGWAEVYVYGGHPFKRVDSFRRASDAAKKANRGVWGACSGDFHSNQ
jgi:micrococcal nuclease